MDQISSLFSAWHFLFLSSLFSCSFRCVTVSFFSFSFSLVAVLLLPVCAGWKRRLSADTQMNISQVRPANVFTVNVQLCLSSQCLTVVI